MVAAKAGWTGGTSKIEEGFVLRSFDVNVCRTVVIGINHYVKPVDPQDCRHETRIADS